MTLQNLTSEYKKISIFLNERWPIENDDHRTFTRMMKLFEELGELSDEILTSMKLQRTPKIQQFSHQNVEDEFADVMGSLMLLAIELDIDVAEVMQRKIDFTRDRFEMDEENAD